MPLSILGLEPDDGMRGVRVEATGNERYDRNPGQETLRATIQPKQPAWSR